MTKSVVYHFFSEISDTHTTHYSIHQNYLKHEVTFKILPSAYLRPYPEEQ